MKERRHFATLDGLRGVAAIVVVTLHALGPFDRACLAPHASLAVDFFFCLSGFVIAYAYEARLTHTMSFKKFVVARFIRLYPLIFIGAVMGTAVFALKAMQAGWPVVTPSFLLALISELALIPTPVKLADGWEGYVPFDPPAWSLFFELLINFVYAAFVGRLSNRVAGFLLAFGAIVVFVQAYIVGSVNGGTQFNDLQNGLGRVFFPFVCGVLLFRTLTPGTVRKMPVRATYVIPVVLLVILLLPVGASINWLYESCIVVFAFPIIIRYGALDRPGPRITAFYLYLGRISYPLYLLHYPFQRVFGNILRTHNLQGIYFWLMIVAEMGSAIVFSFLVMKFVDEPVREWLGDKWRRRIKKIEASAT